MKLNVLLVSDQVRGIHGTGGLGDVAAALPKELLRDGGLDLRVVMPGYETISEPGHEQRFDDVAHADLPVPFGDGVEPVTVCRYRLPSQQPGEPEVPVYLLRAARFDRSRDAAEQAVLLARATVEFIRRERDFRVDVVHCNDWHTGLIPVYLNGLLADDPYLGRIATVYTTHNTGYGYQGAFPQQPGEPTALEVLQMAQLPAQTYFVGLRTRSLEHHGCVTLAKGGFGYADVINTVSLQYAREIRTPDFAGGLEGVFSERAADLCGIVDGIDPHEFNPATDPALPTELRYDATWPADQVIAAKRRLRRVLSEWRAGNGLQPFAALAAAPDDALLSVVVGRLAEQKLPILVQALPDLLSLEQFQIAILGSAHPADAPGQTLARTLRDVAERQAGLLLYEGWQPALSHLIYAAADLLLMPSTYEPCGLTQQIAMRYGTVPVVRLVGGLADTVLDEQRGGPAATGFGSDPVTSYPLGLNDLRREADAYAATVRRAVDTARRQPARWAELVGNCLRRDASWAVAARQYAQLYEQAVARHRQGWFSP